MLYVRTEDPSDAWEQLPISSVDHEITSDELSATIQGLGLYGVSQSIIDPYLKAAHEMRAQQYTSLTGDPVERTALDSILDEDEPPVMASCTVTSSRTEELRTWVTESLRAVGRTSVDWFVNYRPVGTTELELRRVMLEGLERGSWVFDQYRFLTLP
jgi:hypothetical protein